MRVTSLVLAAALAATGCKSSGTPAPPAAAPAGSGSGGAALPTTYPDPGPVFTQSTGPTKMVEEADVEVQATVRLATGGHLLLVAQAPADLARGTSRKTTRVLVNGARHGVAALEGTHGGAPTHVLVRLVGEELPAGPVELAWYTSDDSGTWWRFREDPWQVRTVRIGGADKATDEPALAGRYWQAFAETISAWGTVGWSSTRPFAAFAEGRALLLAGKAPGSTVPPAQRQAKTDIGTTMSLYTGATSIEEALQSDRGLLVRGEAAEERTVPLESIETMGLPKHPWDEMIAKIGKEPVIEPLASSVPSDMLYLHFRDLREAVKIAKDVQEWVTPAMQALERRAGDSHLAERYQAQLMVERTGLSETLGHLAAKGVAVTASDPMFREGTDVSLLFLIENETLLNTALEKYATSAAARHPDLAKTTYEVGGHTVALTATPDRTVSQHRLKLGGVLILSTSRSAIEKFIAVADGKVTSLAKSGDFRTMRALYPHSQDEEGFAFLSDDFVAHVISPRTKILASRRMAAQADLLAVGYAALLSGFMEGKAPESAEAIVTTGYLGPEDLKHADGTPIALDMRRGASSEKWGRPYSLTPLSELTIDKATPAEKLAYDRFRETYQSYWRGAIDPVAIRIDRSDDGKEVSIDARMLPLIENSEYDSLIRSVGHARIEMQPLGAGFAMVMGVGDDASLRRELDGLGRMMGRSDLEFGWLGNWVAVGAADRGGLWDLALLEGGVPEADSEARKARREKQWDAIKNAPFWAGAHVKNKLGFAATMTAVKGAVTSVAPGVVEWREAGEHRKVPIVAIAATAGADSFERGLDGLAIHYAMAGDAVLVSLDLPTLKGAIDMMLDGRGPKALPNGEKEGLQSVISAGTNAGNSWFAKAILGQLEGEMRAAMRSAWLDMETLARGLGGLPPEGPEREALAMGFLGYEPGAAHGGSFSMGKDGLLTHSLYGTQAAPTFPALPLADSPVTKLIGSIESLHMGVGFEGEGVFRGLRAKMGWKRR